MTVTPRFALELELLDELRLELELLLDVVEVELELPLDDELLLFEAELALDTLLIDELDALLDELLGKSGLTPPFPPPHPETRGNAAPVTRAPLSRRRNVRLSISLFVFITW